MQILKYPDPRLMKRTRPIGEITAEVLEQIAQMRELMYQGDGVGLAAPQVGWSVRMFLMNPSGDSAKTALEHIVLNPRILKRRGRELGQEGCLSFPKIFAEVERAKAITMEYTDLSGVRQNVDLSGFEARIAQHEIDHLDNVLMIHRMSEADRIQNREALDELERGATKPSSTPA